MAVTNKKRMPAGHAACLMCVLVFSCSGCVHVNNGQLLALAPLMQERSADPASWVWLWLGLGAAALAWALVTWRGARRRGGRDRAGQGAPLDREEMALYRTTHDSLSFLIKKRIRRTKVVPIDFLRRRKGRE